MGLVTYIGYSGVALFKKDLYSTGPGILCLHCFLRLWKNNHVSRKPRKQRSDLVLNGQMRLENSVSRGLPVDLKSAFNFKSVHTHTNAAEERRCIG